MYRQPIELLLMERVFSLMKAQPKVMEMPTYVCTWSFATDTVQRVLSVRS